MIFIRYAVMTIVKILMPMDHCKCSDREQKMAQQTESLPAKCDDL